MLEVQERRIHRRTSAARSRTRRAPIAALMVLSLLASMLAPTASAQEPAPAPPPPPAPVAVPEVAAEPTSVLRADVEERFRVLPLRNGLLLEPLEDLGGIAAIEVGRDGFVVDGVPVAAEDLDERLGESAEVVRRLGALDPSAARELFADGGAPPAPPADDEPEVVRKTARVERVERDVRTRRERRTDAQVVVGNSVVIEADEVARDVVVFGGGLTVRGEVIGDAAAIGGSVVLEPGAEVTGDVAAVGGSVTLRADTEVGGDVASVGNQVEIDSTAIVRGEIVEVPFSPRISFGWPDGDWDWGWTADWDDWDGYRWWGFGRFFEVVWKFFALILLALLGCLAYLLAQVPVERMERRVRTEAWKAGLVGLVAQILFVPLIILVCIILAVSIIGIPLLLLVPFLILALMVANFLGYTAVALRLGTWSEERFGWNMVNPYVAVVVGVLMIQVWSFVGNVLDLAPGPLWFFAFMFAIFGVLVKYVAWTVGLGAALLTRFGTSDEGGDGAPGALPPVPRPGSEPGEAGVTAESAEEDLPELPDIDWDEERSGAPGGDEPSAPEPPPAGGEDEPRG